MWQTAAVNKMLPMFSTFAWKQASRTPVTNISIYFVVHGDYNSDLKTWFLKSVVIISCSQAKFSNYISHVIFSYPIFCLTDFLSDPSDFSFP